VFFFFEALKVRVAMRKGKDTADAAPVCKYLNPKYIKTLNKFLSEKRCLLRPFASSENKSALLHTVLSLSLWLPPFPLSLSPKMAFGGGGFGGGGFGSSNVPQSPFGQAPASPFGGGGSSGGFGANQGSGSGGLFSQPSSGIGGFGQQQQTGGGGMGGFGQPQQTASPGTSECCCFARRVFF
jgi:hypothetical protein